MKIVFIGCVESSEILLKILIENHKDISGVITKETSAFNADFRCLKPLCENNKIDYICVKNVNDEESVEFIKTKNPDLIYCFGWSQLVKSEILAIPRLGCIGFHPAKLPHNRGRHPIIWALALGLEKTASTFFKMTADADAGELISQEDIVIENNDNARTLYDKIMLSAQRQMIEFTDAFEKGTVKIQKQNIEEGNVWRKRGAADGRIDWRMSGYAICNLVRALTSPYIGADFEYGGECIKVWRAECSAWENYVGNIEPGKVLKVISETEFYVKAYDGVVHIVECDKVPLKEGDYL